MAGFLPGGEYNPREGVTPMADITILQGDQTAEYQGAHSITINDAGVLTFYWSSDSSLPGLKIITSAPFIIKEEIG
jgi:hypothetical protein